MKSFNQLVSPGSLYSFQYSTGKFVNGKMIFDVQIVRTR